MLRLVHRHHGLILSQLVRDERGFTLVFTAFAMSVLMGFAGLAVDVGYWQAMQQNMQGAADQAAYSAVIASGAGGGASPTTQAKGITASMGFVDGQAGVTVAVNNPPSQGNYTANNLAWEIIIQQPQPMWFTQLFLSSAPTASKRAVALAQGGFCLIALDPSASKALNISGSAAVDVSTCNVYVNSTDSNALNLSGGATLTADDAYIVGNDCGGGCSGLSVSNTLKTSATAIADPYASRTAPTVGACTSSAGSYSGTISPGVYCSGISASGPLTLSPGVYIIYGGSFKDQGGGGTLSGGVCTGSGAWINASGVTIYLVANGGTTGNIAVSACLSITAPTTGNTAGMAFWVDQNEKSGDKDAFSGGSNVAITGTIYAPDHEVDYTGSASATSPCTQIVADIINFSGSASFQSNCGGVGVAEIGTPGAAKLAE